MTRRQRPGAPGSRLVPGVMASSPASRTALVVGGVSLRWTPGVGDSLRRPHPAPDGARHASDPGAFGAVQSFPVAERSLLSAPGRQANVGRGPCGVNGRTGQQRGVRTGSSYDYQAICCTDRCTCGGTPRCTVDGSADTLPPGDDHAAVVRWSPGGSVARNTVRVRT